MPKSNDTPSSDHDGPPAFDPVFEDASAEERVYAVVLQIREPTPVSELTERADCDRATARKYLDWFAELSIVTKYNTQQPVTYERNEAYFEWRRINEIAQEYTIDELRDRVGTIRDRILTYQETYNATTPSTVNALSVVMMTQSMKSGPISLIGRLNARNCADTTGRASSKRIQTSEQCTVNE